MIYNVHAGHNAEGKVACGAVGLIKESTEARKVTERVIELLKEKGHTVYDCTVNNGISQSDVLSKIVKKCNAHKVNLDVSIHFNEGRNDKKGDGSTGGTEVLVYDANSKAMDEAVRICNKLAKLGLRNRGVKTRKDLYFLRKTKSPSLLIEAAFVDDADDVAVYDCDKVAKAIVEGILNTTLTTKKSEEQKSTTASSAKKTPFKVKVLTKELNIRKGAGTENKIVGKITDKGTYTIDKVSGSWGHLVSNTGWINISTKYVKYV